MDEHLAEVVKDIEEEQALGRVSAVQVFRSMINQPALVSLSSANANRGNSDDGFSEFTVNLPRPILKAQTLQLLDATIPLPTANIPDTACAFWYYRLSAYSGVEPNTDNLNFVRLLPSYYNTEFISNAASYGSNQTFNNYSNVATQLALSCSNDLAVNNQFIVSQCSVGAIAAIANEYKINYIPNDISLTYNGSINKFQMTGQNAYLPFATNAWASSNTYALNAVVYYSNAATYPNIATYQSLQASNSNQNPVTQTTWWKRVYTDIVQTWDSNTQYRQGQLTYFNLYGYNNIYKALADNHLNGPGAGFIQVWDVTFTYQRNDVVSYSGGTYVCGIPNTAIVPTSLIGVNNGYWYTYEYSAAVTYPLGLNMYHTPTNATYQSVIAGNLNNTPSVLSSAWTKLFTGANFWTVYAPETDAPNYRYLATGYNDPNVVLNQGTGKRQWSPYALYETATVVEHNAVSYTAIRQNQNFVPFTIPTPTTWTSTRSYSIGDCVTYLGDNYYAIAASGPVNPIAPGFGAIGLQYWREQEWRAYWTYQPGFICSYTAPSSPTLWFIATRANTGSYPSGLSPDWSQQMWTTAGTAQIVGLNKISSKFDMLTTITVDAVTGPLFPFPVGIPGQPFNPVPRRLLNSILGFTWNGQFTPAVLRELFTDNQYAFVEGNTELFNRIRPIPRYAYIGEDLGSVQYGTGLSSTLNNQVLTAAGYANLVYTSIVSIYATIVGGSTLNTQRSTNLLAMISMNAGNLGISYYQQFIDNTLKVYGSDIYTIGIELRDEVDEPYLLTNNAVVSLTMKLTYEE